MCGICGYINFSRNVSNEQKIIEKMTNTLALRGPDDFGYFISPNALLGHRRLTIVDPEGGSQPMIKTWSNKKYIIVYNGELYNTEDVRKELLKDDFKFSSYSDTEVLLCSFIKWGKDCLNHINGIFSFAIFDEEKEELFIARDHLGVKPLFYSYKNNNFLFGSELKTILAHPEIDAVVDKEGLLQLFSLGPARVLGSAIYKDIYEVPPAHFLILNKEGYKLINYWKPVAKKHEEDVEETSEHLKALLYDAIKRQLVADVPLCTFLSGGLDSSLISAIAANEFRKTGKTLDTYSIDYVDNDKFFKSNMYQPSSDTEFVGTMEKFISSNHHYIINQNKNLANGLKESVIAYDLPGMADIDSSLYLFCKEVQKKHTVALSGECADEIFGGYPWYTNNELLYSNRFPWYRDLNSRKNLLNNKLKALDLEGYSKEQYDKTLKDVTYLDDDTKLDRKIRDMFYINIKWFMMTLLTRKDRMSMSNSLEARVPFADHRLVEYAFNIPAKIKLLDGREKGILRKASENLLPKEIVDRKKSPYPKTHSPIYTSIVKKELQNIIKNKKSPIHELIDLTEVKELIRTSGKSYVYPWFGQLMTGPQLMAYLIQINMWLDIYQVKIEWN